MSEPTSPLDVAALLDRHGTQMYRDAATGLYVVDSTVPPTLLTFRQYEAGMRVLALREKVARDAR